MRELRYIATFGVLVLAITAATGCGNKGALYIPEPPPETQDATAPQN